VKRMFAERVAEWNRSRGLLEQGFDPQLEIWMLTEEAREFVLAEDKYQKLQEAADFLFVFNGTEAKFYAETFVSYGALETATQGFYCIQDWVSHVHAYHRNVIAELFFPNGSTFGGSTVVDLLEIALDEVIKANERKPKDTVSGKIIKGPDYESPLPQIKARVEERLHGYTQLEEGTLL